MKEMRQRFYGNCLKKLIFSFTLGLITYLMKIMSFDSYDFNENNVKLDESKDSSVRWFPNDIKFFENNDIIANQEKLSKLSNSLITIVGANTQRENYKNGMNWDLRISEEAESEQATVDELQDTKGTKTYLEIEMDEMNREKVVSDDPRLIQFIRNHFIVPPSDQPYKLSDMNKFDTSMGQAAFVDNRLRFKEYGFFVESGAHDGEYLSNTLYLERTRYWSGVLIEPLPESFKALTKKHRKASAINACLSLHSYPSMEYLTTTPVLGTIVQENTFSQRYDEDIQVRVQCLPLYSILLALNRTKVDFLSLDVEGVEQSVLDTIPWNKVDIDMVSVEFDKWPGGRDALCSYMEERGYDCSVTIQAPGAADFIFQKLKKRP